MCICDIQGNGAVPFIHPTIWVGGKVAELRRSVKSFFFKSERVGISPCPPYQVNYNVVDQKSYERKVRFEFFSHSYYIDKTIIKGFDIYGNA